MGKFLENFDIKELVTVVLIGGLVWGFIQERIGDDQFFSIVTLVTGFWFGQKTTTNGSTTNGNGSATNDSGNTQPH